MDKKIINFSLGSLARLIISEEFKSPKWELFRNWLFKNTPEEERKIIQEEFYEELKIINEVIPFVPWFINKYVSKYVSII